MTAMTAMPSDADALPLSPARDALADCVDRSDHLMPGHARVLDAGECPKLGEGVAVADSAGLDPDPHTAWCWLRDRTLDQLERSIGVLHLNGTHVRHRDLHHPASRQA